MHYWVDRGEITGFLLPGFMVQLIQHVDILDWVDRTILKSLRARCCAWSRLNGGPWEGLHNRTVARRHTTCSVLLCTVRANCNVKEIDLLVLTGGVRWQIGGNWRGLYEKSIILIYVFCTCSCEYDNIRVPLFFIQAWFFYQSSHFVSFVFEL